MSDLLLTTAFIPLFFLLGFLSLTAVSVSLLELGKFHAKEFLQSKHGPSLFFSLILKKIFLKKEWENLHFSLSFSKLFYQISYGISSFFHLLFLDPTYEKWVTADPSHKWIHFLSIGGWILALALLLDFMFRLLSSIWSKSLLRFFAPIASCYLSLLLPLSLPLLHLIRRLFKKTGGKEEILLIDKGKIREMLQESDLEPHLDHNDQKMISSFIHFKKRVAKEIMVPRVDLFSLEASTTIRQAADLLAQENYSRVPIYKESLDQIEGVVLYKDLLNYYAQKSNLDAPISSLAKPVFFAPENKKIAHLLQEFRSRQIHMAIIVDEYGGTEGVVTIEDILEELVGEIEDESDVEEEHDAWRLPNGSWVVDAKMTIHDIEEKTGIAIPENPEYETIGGFIYHIAGMIPAKGWRLSRDAFDLEILSSNERSIKKIRLTPRSPTLS